MLISTMTESFHILPDQLLHRPVVIHLIGCGGTGSQLVPRLAQLSKCMIELGHPHGLELTVWDGDAVAAHNTLRQNFALSDVGHNKASVMVNRCNMAFGLDWRDEPRMFSRSAHRGSVDFVIGCVDSIKARAEIDAFVREQWQTTYWIDAGNEAATGQVIVGQFSRRTALDPCRLPLVSELYPEIIEGEDSNAPSCSARESILKQGLATNGMAAIWAYAWLAEALRHGRISWSGVFFSLDQGKVTSIPATKSAWDAIRPAPLEIMAQTAA